MADRDRRPLDRVDSDGMGGHRQNGAPRAEHCDRHAVPTPKWDIKSKPKWPAPKDRSRSGSVSSDEADGKKFTVSSIFGRKKW